MFEIHYLMTVAQNQVLEAELGPEQTKQLIQMEQNIYTKIRWLIMAVNYEAWVTLKV